MFRLETISQMVGLVATALCRRSLARSRNDGASTQRGGYNIYEVASGQFWNLDILRLSTLLNASEMAGTPLHAIAPVAVASAEHTCRRIALRLLPFVFGLYIVNYLDRTSVAYAATGMARDLGFGDRVFALGIGVFFLSYVILVVLVPVTGHARVPKSIRST